MPTGSGKKWIKYVVFGALAYWILTAPTDAAASIHRILAGLTSGADSLSAFISALS